MHFCLGYFFCRLAPIAPERTRKRLILAGFALWALDVAFAYFGIDRFDPSYPWLFATIAMIFIFDRIRITNPTAQRAIEWTARRSYSIYLLQYTAIALAAPFVYETLLNGGIGSFIAPMRLLVWIAMVASAYLISLAAASIIDTTLLRGAQAIYNKVVLSLLKSSKERAQCRKRTRHTIKSFLHVPQSTDQEASVTSNLWLFLIVEAPGAQKPDHLIDSVWRYDFTPCFIADLNSELDELPGQQTRLRANLSLFS